MQCTLHETINFLYCLNKNYKLRYQRCLEVNLGYSPLNIAMDFIIITICVFNMGLFQQI